MLQPTVVDHGHESSGIKSLAVRPIAERLSTLGCARRVQSVEVGLGVVAYDQVAMICAP